MPREDWERVKEIFDAAKVVPESELDAVLKSLCGDDVSRAAFIRDLVLHHSESVVNEPAGTSARVFSPGTLIGGRLRIVRFIDSGAMGEVYEAQDERLRLRVALKTVRTDLASSGEALARFEREIRLAREVTHPNLCRVFDYVEHGGAAGSDQPVHCYTMELIEGESLSAKLAKERPLPLEEALSVIRQIAEGLDALHSRGIIHRDLKPSNIMLAPSGVNELRVVLMDFGLAKLLTPEEEVFQSRVDLHAGAPYFMAPELLRDGSPSIASDLYALGLIVDEMVTRSRAFPGQSLQSLYFAKLWEGPVSPALRSDALPVGWQNAILRCLATEPADRYQSARCVVASIEAKEAATPFVASAGSDAQPIWTRAAGPRWGPMRRSLFLKIALAVLLVAGVLCGFYVARPVSTSIQVFDVDNATNSPSYGYLCQGTSNELVRRLSRLPNLRVIPMHSHRDSHSDSQAARFAVDGTLRASNEKLQLNIIMSDNRSGEVFDSLDIESKFSDSLQVENEIAGATVVELEKHLLLGGAGPKVAQSSIFPIFSKLLSLLVRPSWAQASSGPTVNSTAFDLYLRGRQLLDEYSASSVQASIPYLRRAVAEDPGFALGYAALAEAQLNETTFVEVPRPEALSEARANAEMAAALDPSLGEAEAAIAYVLQEEWDWHGAEQHFRKALLLKPSYAAARRRYAGLLLQFGRVDEAINLAEQAFAQDPYDRGAVPGIGLYYYLAGRYDDAIRFLDQQIGSSDMAGARYNLGDAYAEKAIRGSTAERAKYFELALAQAARVASLEKRTADLAQQASLSDEMYAHYFTLMGDHEAAQPYFARLTSALQDGRESPVVLAWIYNLNGEQDRALDLLEQALASRDRVMFYIKQFPALASLRSNARFREIVSRMKL